MEIFVGLAAGAIVVGLAAWLVQEFRWRQKNAELRGQLTRVQDAEQLMQTTEQRMSTAFQAAAAPVMKQNMEQFLASAKDSFGQSRKSFEELVKPLRENYEKLNPNIDSLTRQLGSATAETARLANALTDNRQIGSWGEFQLARILELTGMTPYIDYSEQETVQGSGERPDVIVHLPDERDVVIDSKASLIAYLEASDASEDLSRDAALDKHARALRAQVDDLAKKGYGDKVRGSLEFVVMFVPGDQFLSAALEANSSLVDYAMNKKVVIATPSTLFALLTALAYGWRQYHLAQNAEEIRKAGEEMHGRLLTFIDRFGTVGQRLDASVRAYNESIASFDSRLIPQAQKFAQLRGMNPDDYSLPNAIDREPRLSRKAVVSGEDADTTAEDTHERA